MGLDSNDLNVAYKTDALKVVNQYLEDRTTLSAGGSRLTESDRVMFHCLHTTYQNMTYAEKEKYINLSRWVSYVQCQPDIRGTRNKLNFSRNLLY